MKKHICNALIALPFICLGIWLSWEILSTIIGWHYKILFIQTYPLPLKLIVVGMDLIMIGFIGNCILDIRDKSKQNNLKK